MILNYLFATPRSKKTTSISKFFVGIITLASVFMVASHVYASVTPTLSLYATNDGNTVQMNVTGDPNVSVMFYYTKVGVSQQQIASLGNTSSSGSFSGTISSSQYGIVTGSPVHVTLNGINGPASSVVSWPTVTTTSNANQISFSQTSLTLAVGQANTITVANNTTGSSLYISNNSSPSVANVNLLNGNQITVTGNLYGSTVVTVCSTGTVACGTFSVAVNSTGTSGGVGTLIISQSNPIIAVGQSTNIVVSGGTGSGYYISSNSNPSILQTNLSNNVLTITALVNGYSSINICDSANNCGQVVVTVSYSSNSNPIILSQTSLSIAVGQSSSVTLTGGVTPYNLPISSNSIYQASLNGNSLNISGVSAGTAQVLVCSAGGGCSTLSLVVTGSSSNYSALTFSQNNISLIPGQNTTVSISGTGSYYISNNSNSNVAGAIISGNNIMISSVGAGTSNINVCQSGGQCAILYITVSTVNSSLYTGTSFLSLNQSNTSVYIGQITTVSISGSGVYTVTYNSNPSIVSTNISGSVLSLTGAKNGYAVVVVCDSSNNCAPVTVVVGSANPLVSTVVASVTPPAVVNPSILTGFKFSQYLQLGSVGTEVSELQKRLIKEGVYSGPVTGKFGGLTKAAVIKYQSLHKLVPSGIVGILTRAVMNNQ